jgi:N-acetylmuramoyl-L-alanine amidase
MSKTTLLFFIILVFIFSGCASAPIQHGGFTTFQLNSAAYIPLISFCKARAIEMEYDTYARTVELHQGVHKVKLRVGDTMAFVDGALHHLDRPVDLYQGTVVVPDKFRRQVLESVFKQALPAAQVKRQPLKIKKVVIDAGHGGKDPGAIGKSGLREKDVNLDIAKRLALLLKKEGIEVVMTRNTDTYIPLEKRVTIANGSRSDLFLSVHTNANRVRSLSGFEVYYVSPSVSDAQRALQASQQAVLNLDSSSYSSLTGNLKAILWDMIYNYNRAEAITLAHSVCSIANRCLEADVRVKGARYYVLKGVRMPAVLIEVGYVSNSTEERFLKNHYYREKVAESIRDGLLRYAEDQALMQARN